MYTSMQISHGFIIFGACSWMESEFVEICSSYKSHVYIDIRMCVYVIVGMCSLLCMLYDCNNCIYACDSMWVFVSVSVCSGDWIQRGDLSSWDMCNVSPVHELLTNNNNINCCIFLQIILYQLYNPIVTVLRGQSVQRSGVTKLLLLNLIA